MTEQASKTAAPRKAASKSTSKTPAKAASGTRKSASPRKTARSDDHRPDANGTQHGSESSRHDDRDRDHDRDRETPAQSGWQVALEAARQLRQLTGSDVEGITGLRRTDDGWSVQVDVLELHRVPTTTDVIATYDVDVDASGDLIGYHRRHRFVRGEVGDDR